MVATEAYGIDKMPRTFFKDLTLLVSLNLMLGSVLCFLCIAHPVDGRQLV